MTKNQLNQLVEETQYDVNKIVPNLVDVSISMDEDTNQPILCGEYYNHKYHTKSTWTERIDRYFTDNKLFLMFFEQRKNYMLATPAEQVAFTDHPSQF